MGYYAVPKPEKKQRRFITAQTMSNLRVLVWQRHLKPLYCVDCHRQFFVTVAENPPGRSPGLLVFRTWEDVPSTIHCSDHERGVNNQ